MDNLKILSLIEYSWGYSVQYIGPLDAMIAADIVPAEFFNFGKRKARSIGKGYAPKSIGAVLPEGVGRVIGHIQKRGFNLSVRVKRHPSFPFYVPPGDTWPMESDSRYHVGMKCEKPPTAEIIDFSKFRKPVRVVHLTLHSVNLVESL